MTRECNIPEGFDRRAAIELQHTEDGLIAGLEAIVSASTTDLQQFGVRGFQLVNERFSWSKIAANMIEVYAWLTSGGVRPDCVATT